MKVSDVRVYSRRQFGSSQCGRGGERTCVDVEDRCCNVVALVGAVEEGDGS